GVAEGLAGQIRFMRRTLLRVTLILAPFLLLALVRPGLLIATIAPGFGGERLELAVRLLLLTAPTALLATYFVVTRCLHETRLRFATPCFVNVSIPLVSVVTLSLLAGRWSVYALALGPLLGNLVGVVLLHLLLRRTLQDPPSFTAQPQASVAQAAHRR